MKAEELLLTLGAIVFAFILVNNVLFLPNKKYSNNLRLAEITDKNDVEKKLSYARFFIFSIVFIVLAIIFFFCVMPLVIKDWKEEITEDEKRKEIILSSHKQSILERDIALLADYLVINKRKKVVLEDDSEKEIKDIIKETKDIIEGNKEGTIIKKDNDYKIISPVKAFVNLIIIHKGVTNTNRKKDYKKLTEIIYTFLSFLTKDYKSKNIKQVVIMPEKKLNELKIKESGIFYCKLEDLLSFFKNKDDNKGISFDISCPSASLELAEYFQNVEDEEDNEISTNTNINQKEIEEKKEEKKRKKMVVEKLKKNGAEIVKGAVFDIINLLIKILCNFVSCPVVLMGFEGLENYGFPITVKNSGNFDFGLGKFGISIKEFNANALALSKDLKLCDHNKDYDFSFSQDPEKEVKENIPPKEINIVNSNNNNIDNTNIIGNSNTTVK